MSKVRKGLLAELGAQSALEELRVRAAGRRPKGRSYLIVCEGTETEPNYDMDQAMAAALEIKV